MQLAYQRWGSKKISDPLAPKLLFLHGMGGTGKLWRPIAAGLEESVEILAPDQRGHGGSQITSASGTHSAPSYTPLDYGSDVVETVEALHFHPTFVVGHSMGVRTAVAFAYLKPDWISGLVLIDIGLSGPAGGGLGDGLASFLKLLPRDFPSRLAAKEFMQQNCPDPSIAQYLMAVSQTLPDQSLTFPFDHSALIQTIEAVRDVSVRSWLETLAEKKIPTLILRGEKSLVWSKEDFEKEVAFFQNHPSILFETFEGAGHGLPFEKRPQFVTRLKEFIQYTLSKTPKV